MKIEIAPEKRALTVGIFISVVIHLLFFSFTKSPLSERLYKPSLREVQYIEEIIKKKPQVSPKVRKLLAKAKSPEPPKPGKVEKILGEKVEKPKLLEEPEIKLSLTKKPLIPEQETEMPKINIEKVQQLAETQAPIDIENLEPTLPGEGVDVVIAPGSKVKSTEDILKEAPVPTVKISKGELGGGTGGIGIGGGGGGVGGGGVVTLTETLGLSVKPQIKVKKETPKLPPEPAKEVKKEVPKVEIHGDIAKRVRKKVLPVYPERARWMGWEGEVQISLQVDASGNVIPTSVVVVRTSGYPDLDQAAKSAAMRWVFDPLPPNVVQEVQSGIIIFRFVLEY